MAYFFKVPDQQKITPEIKNRDAKVIQTETDFPGGGGGKFRTHNQCGFSSQFSSTCKNTREEMLNGVT